jgi:hypothetical protein
MAVLENAPKNYSTLVTEVTTGQVKIPQFQRQFVWDKVASAKLIDSMIKGYPIGTFIFWRTDEELRSVRNIGNIKLPDQGKGEFVNYVLDGQQRITSVFAAIKGEIIEREDGKKEDFSDIYIYLDAKEDSDVIITDISEKEKDSIIRLTDLMEGNFELLASYPKTRHPIIHKYQNILKGYNFNVINLKDASIDVATEVFTRLNVGGRALTLFEIMVAKTYDVASKFDLSEKYNQLCTELGKANYENIPSATILQVVSMLIKKDVKRSTILKLEKQQFIKTWPIAVDCIKKSVDFFRGYGVVVSRLLPYPALIVPFSYFFYKHKNSPTGEMKKMLEDYFWRAAIGTRYSSGVEGKLAQDVTKIDSILLKKLPKYEWSIDVSPESLMKQEVGWFSTGRSLVKAILCLYAIHKPKSFDSGQNVTIDNSWLKVSTSKNYHHFFPRAYMKKNYPNMNYWLVNHVLNITIVDEFLNKAKIKAKAPSSYMKQFVSENDDINKTMRTHLIGDFDKFGINSNNYDKFFKERAKLVSKELEKRIINQSTGQEQQVDVLEDHETEPEIVTDED